MGFRLSILLHYGNIEVLVFLVMRPLRRTKEVKRQHCLLYTRLEILRVLYEITLGSSLIFSYEIATEAKE